MGSIYVCVLGLDMPGLTSSQVQKYLDADKVIKFKSNNEYALKVRYFIVFTYKIRRTVQEIEPFSYIPAVFRVSKVIGQLAAQLFHYQVCANPSLFPLQISR